MLKSICFNTCFYQIKELSGIFLPALSPCPSLSSLKVDKLTFQSAAKNLTHDLDLLSLNLLTYNQQNKPSSQGNLLKVTLDMTNFILGLSLPKTSTLPLWHLTASNCQKWSAISRLITFHLPRSLSQKFGWWLAGFERLKPHYHQSLTTASNYHSNIQILIYHL